MKTVNIHGKEYVEVNQRLKAFRTLPEFDGWSLETEVLREDDQSCTMRGVIRDAAGRVIATGVANERADGPNKINRTSHHENCETSAWGRALGNLGIGIDGAICTAEEVARAIERQQQMDEPRQKPGNGTLAPAALRDIQAAVKASPVSAADFTEFFQRTWGVERVSQCPPQAFGEIMDWLQDAANREMAEEVAE